MVRLKRIVLDVLKPHEPGALEFTAAIAAVGAGYHVHLTVCEVDENTQTVRVVIEAAALDFEGIAAVIRKMAGSLHSVDEVDVVNEADADR